MPDCDCPDIPSEDSRASNVPEFRTADRSHQSYSKDCTRSVHSQASLSSNAQPSISAASNNLAAQKERAGAAPKHIVWGDVEASSSEPSSSLAHSTQTPPGRAGAPPRHGVGGLGAAASTQHVVWGEVEAGSSDPSSSAEQTGRSRSSLNNKHPEVEFLDRSSDEAAPLRHRPSPAAASEQPATVGAAPAVAARTAAQATGSQAGSRGVAAEAESTQAAQQPPPARKRGGGNSGGARQPVEPISEEMFVSLVPHIPLDENGDLTSVGSIAHARGNCKPCIFKREVTGCSHGPKCQFCHLPHRGKDFQKMGKDKRNRYRDLITRRTAEMGASQAE